MGVNLEPFLFDSARKATRSEIRELLKLADRPEVINLAGGMPAPELFPVDELAELLPAVLRQYGSAALQYGPTEGDAGLVQSVIGLTAADGVTGLDASRVLIVTASQQGLDLCARMFVGPGDTVVCELPSYLGALGAFSACGAHLAGVPLDSDGIRTDLLEQRLIELRRAGARVKLLYTIPDFQNPTGATLALARRRELLDIATRFDLLVVEDSPYRQLRYAGEPLPSLAALDRDGRVISLFSFSKILFPGLRLGWIVASAEIVSRMVTVKQAMDLCTSPLGQLVAREYLRSGRLPALIERIRTCYSTKRAVLLDALERHFDPEWGVSWTQPEGGMFVWVTLRPWMDARRLLERSLEENVAFVVGTAFHCDGSGHNTLRLNFTYAPAERLETGVSRLARAIGRMIAEAGRKRYQSLPSGVPCMR